MSEFSPISPNEDHEGLVWFKQVTPRYLVELQTGIVPQIVHLVIFDTENDNEVVHNKVRAYEIGDGMDAQHMAELQAAIGAALKELS